MKKAHEVFTIRNRQRKALRNRIRCLELEIVRRSAALEELQIKYDRIISTRVTPDHFRDTFTVCVQIDRRMLGMNENNKALIIRDACADIFQKISKELVRP